MKAVVQDGYGTDGVLAIREVDKPVPADDEVLVEMAAASLHAGDYFLSTGVPYVMRLGTGLRGPRRATPGFDISGVVLAVGNKVTDFQQGDEVFGQGKGSCAEFVVAKAKHLVPRPDNLSLEESAPLAISGITALRGVRDAAEAGPGVHLLINGASGGVGTYAVQVAKSLGAEVTGVCSTRNIETVREIGADHVIDYITDDLTAGDARYDVILDNVGNITLAQAKQVLTPSGRLIPNSGRTEGRWFGPFGRMIKGMVLSLFIRNQGRPFFAPVTKDALLDLKQMVEAGHVRPVIENTYTLAETPQAMRDVGAGHVRGKVLITP